MNRGDSQSPSASNDSQSADRGEQYAQAEEPELLNSYDTPEDDTSFADSGGDSGGDFA